MRFLAHDCVSDTDLTIAIRAKTMAIFITSKKQESLTLSRQGKVSDSRKRTMRCILHKSMKSATLNL